MRISLLILFCWGMSFTYSQQMSKYFPSDWSHEDTLFGANTPHRDWFDVTDYHLDFSLSPEEKTLSGSTTIYFRVTDTGQSLQIDLSSELLVDSIIYRDRNIRYRRENDFIFIDRPFLPIRELDSITVFYHGSPIAAQKPPWEGGVVWEKDGQGQHWLSVSCQMEGAHLWWPSKDLLSDEPDSAQICIRVPTNMSAVSNGDLKYQQAVSHNQLKYCWNVQHPINNYNITFYAGDYEKLTLPYLRSSKDTVILDFWVLSSDTDTAQKHFQQVPDILSSFEKYFGKYPFPKDGYMLVQAPYLGMEHQSAIAYGNKFRNNLSPTEIMGVEGDFHLPYDFAIVHETAHEWWGNSLTAHDMGELWLHEAFATYAEALFVEAQFGKDTALQYLEYQRKMIKNEEPLLGPLNVRFTDWDYVNELYFKGSWVLHTLRHAIDEDSLWFDLLKEFARKNQQQIINTKQWIQHVNEKTDRRWVKFFKQYLNHPEVPTLMYKFVQKGERWKLRYKWNAKVSRFRMPIKVRLGKGREYQTLIPVSGRWKTKQLTKEEKEHFEVAKELFLIKTQNKTQ